MERAAHTVRLYAAFCEAAGVDDVAAVATSAVRDAANGEEVLEALSADGALSVRTLSAEEEAWYGYLGAVNSTTLGDGHVLDLGGGSVQISQVDGRKLGRTMSRPLGRRPHDRALPAPPAGDASRPQGACASTWSASSTTWPGSSARAGGWSGSAGRSGRWRPCTSAAPGTRSTRSTATC